MIVIINKLLRKFSKNGSGFQYKIGSILYFKEVKFKIFYTKRLN